MALLELSNISYVVNEKSIIRDVSLSVHEGEYLTVVGPSGSGKSTLLKLCSDLISPT
ncbi:ATP-binding cassette domain-containing protein, partial [Veillonella parvula]